MGTEVWTFGDRLRSLRQAKKMSQEQVARAVGVGSLSYGKWERGQQHPTDENLKAVASLFEVDPTELGYEAPQGWELVPSEWIRNALEQQQAALRELNDKVDALMALQLRADS